MEVPLSPPEARYVSLTDQYRQTLRLWQHAVRMFDRESRVGGAVENEPGLREAKRFLVNSLSIFMTWGCDIRVETNSLDATENTISGIEIQTIFDDIAANIEAAYVYLLVIMNQVIDSLQAGPSVSQLRRTGGNNGPTTQSPGTCQVCSHATSFILSSRPSRRCGSPSCPI